MLRPRSGAPGPDLGAIGAALRAEWRADEEAWARAAAEAWTHQRSLRELVRELAERGDIATVEVAGRRFRGPVADVGDGVAALDLGDRRVYVTTEERGWPASVVWTVTRVPAGGGRPPGRIGTLRALLLELEARREAVVVATAVPPRDAAGLVTVGRDHVVVVGDAEVVMPLRWVAYVLVPADPTGVLTERRV